MDFNQNPPTIMHVDLNSCFATIEQQANPFLRGLPIAVAAYPTPSGCILAPSIEAKKLGVKVGMRVKDGQKICPNLKILGPDPNKYRYIHLKLRKLLLEYSSDVIAKSIDEFAINFSGYSGLNRGLKNVATEIKHRIKATIGDWLTVSIGIGPNRFLAKMGAGLKKPDGLNEINSTNFRKIYKRLTLMDITGIKKANTVRLNSAGIYTVLDFYHAPITQLRSAFHSVNGYYWFLRLHGWEVDDIDTGRKSFGNMFSLPQSLSTPQELAPILSKLIEKCSFRMRLAGFSAYGVHLALLYRDHTFWHQSHRNPRLLSSAHDIYRRAFFLLTSTPTKKPVATVSVTVFDLAKVNSFQLDLFSDVVKKNRLVNTIDTINRKWGNFVITPALMLTAKNLAPDRISFGGVKELEP